jgi:hypothetical protein
MTITAMPSRGLQSQRGAKTPDPANNSEGLSIGSLSKIAEQRYAVAFQVSPVTPDWTSKVL